MCMPSDAQFIGQYGNGNSKGWGFFDDKKKTTFCQEQKSGNATNPWMKQIHFIKSSLVLTIIKSDIFWWFIKYLLIGT